MIARRILVPLDGSEAAATALPVALEMVAASGGQLFIVHAIAGRLDPEPAPLEGTLARMREAEAYLEDIRNRLAAEGKSVATFLWQGSPAAAIVRAVQHYQIDTVVMTTHGRTGRQEEMFGSVAQAVLRGVTVPVVVVRPTGSVVRTPPGEAIPWPS